jgi:hypothetical protein
VQFSVNGDPNINYAQVTHLQVTNPQANIGLGFILASLNFVHFHTHEDTVSVIPIEYTLYSRPFAPIQAEYNDHLLAKTK